MTRRQKSYSWGSGTGKLRYELFSAIPRSRQVCQIETGFIPGSFTPYFLVDPTCFWDLTLQALVFICYYPKCYGFLENCCTQARSVLVQLVSSNAKEIPRQRIDLFEDPMGKGSHNYFSYRHKSILDSFSRRRKLILTLYIEAVLIQNLCKEGRLPLYFHKSRRFMVMLTHFSG